MARKADLRISSNQKNGHNGLLLTVLILLNEKALTFFLSMTQEYHGGFKKTAIHPASDFGDPTAFGDLDPDQEFIVSTR